MKDVIIEFDQFLKKRGLRFEGTVIGGAALIIMGVVDRVTKDIDCLEPALSEEILAAAAEFRSLYSGPNSPLKEDWLNNGPASLIQDLPPGWEKRRVLLFAGRALRLMTLGRIDSSDPRSSPSAIVSWTSWIVWR